MNRCNRYTKNEALAFLDEWKRHHDELDEKFDSLSELFGDCTGSDFHEAIWNMFSAYTESLAGMLGDEDDWLDWYWLENRWGQRKLAAKGAEMKREKKICSLEDLALLLGFTE